MIELRPHPISKNDYHDHKLIGLSILPSEVELLIESPAGERTSVRLGGVRYFLGTDILQGNIIDCIDCHKIDSQEVTRLVLSELHTAGSKYYTEKILSDVNAAGYLHGNYFVAVRPIYGAEIYAIAESIAEVSAHLPQD